MYTEETLSILDEIEDLSDMIVQSKVYFNYREAQKTLKPVSYTHLTLPTNREV